MHVRQEEKKSWKEVDMIWNGGRERKSEHSMLKTSKDFSLESHVTQPTKNSFVSALYLDRTKLGSIFSKIIVKDEMT